MFLQEKYAYLIEEILWAESELQDTIDMLERGEGVDECIDELNLHKRHLESIRRDMSSIGKE